MAETAMPVDVVELVVDRPFLYWIVDEPTGALLFLGRVLDPSVD
jgi:serine protease inhibitor